MEYMDQIHSPLHTNFLHTLIFCDTDPQAAFFFFSFSYPRVSVSLQPPKIGHIELDKLIFLPFLFLILALFKRHFGRNPHSNF